MPIHDVGYREWKGKKTGVNLRWLAITRTGVQVVYRSVWVRRMLLVTWLPALYFAAGLFFFERAVTLAEERGMSPESALRVVDNMLPPLIEKPLDEARKAEDFGEMRQVIWGWMLATLMRFPQAFWVVLLVGLIAPPLISRDVRSRAFLLYFSKPISRFDYIFGKMMVLCTYLAMISMLPVLGLYLFGVFLAPSWTIVFSTWDFPFRILLASAAFIIPASSMALMFSSLTTDAKYAAFSWFAVWGMGGFAWLLIQAALGAQAAEDVDDAFLRGETIQIQADGTEVFVEMDLVSKLKGLELPIPSNGTSVLGDTPNNFWSQQPQREEVAIDLFISRAKHSPFSLLSMYDTLGRVQSWILGVEKDFSTVWPSIVLLVVQTLVSLVVLFRQVAAPVRV